MGDGVEREDCGCYFADVRRWAAWNDDGVSAAAAVAGEQKAEGE